MCALFKRCVFSFTHPLTRVALLSQNVLYTLGQLSNEFPEVTDALSIRLQEADLKIPSKPAAKQSTTAVNARGSDQ